MNQKNYCTFICIAFLYILFPSAVFAQFKITGHVTDADTKTALPLASVSLYGSTYASQTNPDGLFELGGIPEGNYIITISFVGYSSYTDKIELYADKTIQIALKKMSIDHESITINATRSEKNSGFALTDLDKKELQKYNTGVDLPYLLNQSPSLVTTSDAGAGVGYTGLRIRGSDASRINVTINGVPLNDAESQNVYFVDLPDLASSVENIQIQRGVGSSSNGAGSFGGSVNIMTNKLSPLPYATTSNAIGSFNTLKNNISLGTGLIQNHWGFEGRLSRIKSDGYIDRASSDLNSYYLSGGYFGKKSIVKFTLLSGKEITYQAWNGVPEYLLNTNRTYNSFTYENQVDNYRQDHYQLLLGYDLLKNLHVQVTFHDTRGKGYYEEFKAEDDLYGGGTFSHYNLPDLIIGTDTITSTDLVRRKWLDNNFYGGVFALVYDQGSKLKLTLGGAWNQYDGDHFGEITWARFAGNTHPGNPYEDDQALKTDLNVYVKCYYTLFSKLDLTGDMQIRTVDYRFTGFDEALNSIPEQDHLIFYNPKFGINWMICKSLHYYASVSRGGKEPSRDDYTESTRGSRPKPELMTDFETGLRFSSTQFSAGLNYYYMQYENQLVLTGKVNDVGNYTRINVPNSYRQGFEAEFTYTPFNFLMLKGNATCSDNRIKAFDEYIDNYDDGTQKKISHHKTTLAFSPSWICNGAIGIAPVKNVSLDFIVKHVGKQYLDNTTNSSRKINDYTVCDFRISYEMHYKWLKDIRFSVQANNIFSKKYVSNGYTFSYIYDGNFTTENFYYPQAPSNFMAQVSLGF